MAASDSSSDSGGGAGAAPGWLTDGQLRERAVEEIARAERHGTPLACLLVEVENLREVAQAHGAQLAAQAPRYMAAALRPQLRRFDALGRPSEQELAILLPGADDVRAELVARRALARLRAIKVEVRGERIPLRFAVGLAAWREGVDGEGLLDAARQAALSS